MKKLLFCFALMFGAMFTSCGKTEKAVSSDSISVDTVVTDTVFTDSL